MSDTTPISKSFRKAGQRIFPKPNKNSKITDQTIPFEVPVPLRKEIISRRKEQNPCMDCNQFFPACVMDFDHRDPSLKIDNIAALLKSARRWKDVEKEIAKCDLVCSNCHRIRTSKRGTVKQLRFTSPR